MSVADQPDLRRTVGWVIALNLAYFAVEVGVALAIGAVSLFADSVDFLEDASVNALILLGLRWSLRARARLGMTLAVILLLPSLATLWLAWQKFQLPQAPMPLPLGLAGLGALLVNLTCASLLLRYRAHAGSLTRAAWLSARNDALANLAIIGASVLTVFWRSAWPDLLVGLGIMAINLDAARAVWRAARQERRVAA